MVPKAKKESRGSTKPKIAQSLQVLSQDVESTRQPGIKTRSTESGATNMRLLKTGPYEPGHEKLELIEEYGSKIPRYAILSHTWGSDEVVFEHVRSGTAFEHAAYGKVISAIQQAASDGHEFIWIDSCCIDKASSAELSEAINSMYAWYERSGICYAILEDVPGKDDVEFKNEFLESRWFKRGWTLQELLAPKRVEFFGMQHSTWVHLGDRSKLQPLVSECTSIESTSLTGETRRSVHKASIAERMSWVAKRETTRDEDIAYCMLGLFSVNMPLLYGEGVRAFMRLQEEIMKTSDDQSIFAWVDIGEKDAMNLSSREIIETLDDGTFNREMSLVRRPTEANTYEFPSLATHGLLATSHVAFSQSGIFIPWYHDSKERAPYQMTNRGLQISLDLTPLPGKNCHGLFAADIRCSTENPGEVLDPLCVYFKKMNGHGPSHYARVRCEKLVREVPESKEPTKLFVRQTRL